MVDPETIGVQAPFKDIFPINPAVRASIEESMSKVGFDEAHPIIVWQERNCILDGHTRHLVAVALNLQVAVVHKSFADEYEATEYAINCQKNRRNLTDADIWRYVKALDRRKSHGAEPGGRGNQYTGGNATCVALPNQPSRSAEKTAEVIGTSRGKVEKARRVLDLGTDETKQKLESGEISIHTAYCLTREEVDRKSQSKPARPVQLQSFFDNQVQQPREETLDLAPEPIVTPCLPEASQRSGAIAAAEAALGPEAEEDITVYWLIKPLLDQAAKLIEDTIGHRSTDWLPPYHKMVRRLMTTPEPASWVRCQACNGEKIVMGKGTCTRCSGRGYTIPKG